MDRLRHRCLKCSSFFFRMNMNTSGFPPKCTNWITEATSERADSGSIGIRSTGLLIWWQIHRVFKNAVSNFYMEAAELRRVPAGRVRRAAKKRCL